MPICVGLRPWFGYRVRAVCDDPVSPSRPNSKPLETQAIANWLSVGQL